MELPTQVLHFLVLHFQHPPTQYRGLTKHQEEQVRCRPTVKCMQERNEQMFAICAL